MKKRFLILPLILCCFLIASPGWSQRAQKKDYLITLSTPYGAMKLILFDQTPLHKANFIKLTKEKFYDGLLFHRIIEGFMVQGGDPNSRNAEKGKALGNGDVGYKIPAEFHPDLFHQKGALAAARDNNPEKASSGCQFYIVQGKTLNSADLQRQLERKLDRIPRKPTETQKEVYQKLGGTPHLDGGYTVFGQVIDGLAVVDSIAAQAKDPRDRPMKDIPMSVSAEWMKKKNITKRYGYTFQ
ncbi:peptidylprolyl isomerase [Arundinibacter roseus]|uniref:peptidylprolyl isomerase n=1 Tax=Arundinibacter roseus TaxID=2070510 RepID=A0A4R4K8P8_9BACT|nr:peptidylprolyl isomerase [Arundinibacter roseus]TDB64097.1 peptidylprolyl isomerase [Arundinibacter roseus]